MRPPSLAGSIHGVVRPIPIPPESSARVARRSRPGASCAWGTNDLANLAISGPAADPDGDGIPNFSEYALGLEPDHPDSGVLRTKLELDPAIGGFHVSFTHPSVLSDVEFAWEESTDLLHWQPSQPKPPAPT